MSQALTVALRDPAMIHKVRAGLTEPAPRTDLPCEPSPGLSPEDGGWREGLRAGKQVPV